MTLEEAFDKQETLSTKERVRLVNKLQVVSNILKGSYRNESNPLEVAKEDLDLFNGDKVL